MKIALTFGADKAPQEPNYERTRDSEQKVIHMLIGSLPGRISRASAPAVKPTIDITIILNIVFSIQRQLL